MKTHRTLLLVLTASLTGAANVLADEPLIHDVLTPPGFELQLVHRVDAKTQGSWVNLTAMDDGRMIASDQFGGLFVVTPATGQGATQVRRLPLDLGMAQGLLVHNDDLYVMVNGRGPEGTGLYRARDTDGDGLWDQSELLRELGRAGEHGPHAIIPSPDGESLFIACGNVTLPTEFAWSRPPRVWQADVLLPRVNDPMNMFSSLRPPGGWVAKVSLDGKRWELFAIGFRNQYDIAFNSAGDLFTFDADNEYDIDTPWYRPTRICHVTSGAEFGWRHGTGKWPVYYEDSRPPVVDIGPGSPTGVAFGYGTKYPAKFQQALFAADWSHGRVFAVMLQQEGASYTATVESFLSGAPLPVTDLAVNPADGALYLTTGGRRVTSALWRVVYTGNEPARDAIQQQASLPEAAATRRMLESLHTEGTQDNATAIDTAWPHLAHSDRGVRFAARTVIEQRPSSVWLPRALREPSQHARPYALLAAVRCCEPTDLPDVHRAMRKADLSTLSTAEKLAFLRAVAISHIRYDPPERETRDAIIAKLLAEFPAEDARLSRELASFLLAVRCEEAVPKTVALMNSSPLASDRIHYIHALTQTSVGWTPELRRVYYQQINAMLAAAMNRSMQAYAERIAALADEQLDDTARRGVADLVAMREELSKDSTPVTERPFVRKWTESEVVALARHARTEGDPTRGRRLFAEARCFECHRFRGEGGAVGPDLTTLARRYSPEDIATALADPNATVSDQYRQTAFSIDGRTVLGRIVNLNKQQVMIATDFTDPKHYETFHQDDIEEQYPSRNSPMPAGLLDVLDESELRDLLAYLRSEG